MMNIYTASVLLFLLLILLFIINYRKNIEIEGFVILFRTKRFLRWIDKIANLSRSFWIFIGTAGLITGLFLMVFGIKYLIDVSIMVNQKIIQESAVKLILPSPYSHTSVGYGHILIPFWIWMITVFLIMAPHELFHGIIARAEKVKLKSVGLLLFLIFPGAFVEPDEKSLKKASLMSKLRIFAAGTFANVLTAAFAFLLAVFLWNHVSHPIVITHVYEDSPAYKAGLREGMVLEAINGTPLKPVDFYTYSTFIFSKYPAKSGVAYLSIMNILTNGTFENYTFKPGDNITMTANGKEYLLTLSSYDGEKNRPYIGISAETSGFGMSFIFPLLAFLYNISFAVAVVNILPIYPLDGGQILKTVLEEFVKKKDAEILTTIISVLTLLLLIYSFLGPVIMKWF